MKSGLKKLKQTDEKAVTSELEQLHRRNVFRPMWTENIYEDHKHDSLALIMLLKGKPDKTIKVRGVADRRKQQENINPKDTTSTKILMEAFMITAKIGALKGRDVAMVDTPREYLCANMDHEVHVVFRVTLLELMVESDPALY